MTVRSSALPILFVVLLSVGMLLSLYSTQAQSSLFFSPSNTLDDESTNANAEKTPPKAPSKTEVTSDKEATFDNKTNIAEFLGHVTVKNDQFNLYCDRLVITLKNDRHGLQHGEAIGKVVITQDNVDSEGKVTRSIGRAGRANYDPETGDIVLTDWPQLQQGINNHVATDKNTRMTLNKDGQSTTSGQSKTVIVDAQKQTSPTE